MTEAELIADQLRRAFYGGAWHGPAVFELLEDVSATNAAARPIPDVHSIWELVLHIAAWDNAALVRLSGKKCQPTGTDNFPPVKESNAIGWRKTLAETKRTAKIRERPSSDAALRIRCDVGTVERAERRVYGTSARVGRAAGRGVGVAGRAPRGARDVLAPLRITLRAGGRGPQGEQGRGVWKQAAAQRRYSVLKRKSKVAKSSWQPLHERATPKAAALTASALPPRAAATSFCTSPFR